ncbi:MAG: ABC transporter ATP-binding protein [Oscillospiraceae bacterium]
MEGTTLRLEDGMFCSIVGESGSGKSTLAQLLTGLISATSGNVFFDGKIVSPYERKRNGSISRQIQLVLQNSKAALDPRYTVYDCIAEPIRNFRKCSRSEEKETVEALIEKMGLPKDILKSNSQKISGGQQKRVCIARALAAQPKVIILDEAVSGLDMAVRKSVLDLLKTIHSNTGKSFLFITHDIDAALYTSQKIAVMRGGKIIEEVMYSGDINAFKHPYSQLLISSSLPEKAVTV